MNEILDFLFVLVLAFMGMHYTLRAFGVREPICLGVAAVFAALTAIILKAAALA